MIRASLGQLALGMGGGRAPVLALVYKGSVVKSLSGSLNKMELLAIAPSASPGNLVVDCEAVSGGYGGSASGNANDWSDRCVPGIVAVERVRYSDLPETISYVVGAGGKRLSAGGASTVVGIVNAPSPTPKRLYSEVDRPTGPGAGYAQKRNAAGGASNASIPVLRLEGGAWGQPGLNATTPFQHGSGGGSSATAGIGGGRGGFPGGGGGHGVGGYQMPSSYYGGEGGAGVVRFHVYAWERV